MLTEEEKSLIKTNMENVRASLAPYPGVLLIGATKTVTAERIAYAITECGLTAIGENRVNELREKYDSYPEGTQIHFIGHLQSNKVKYVVGKVCLIHSVDSLELAEAISKRAASLGVLQDILIEVNIGKEPSKSGIMPEEAQLLVMAARSLPAVRVRGLMAIPPVCEQVEQSERYFCKMQEIFQKINQNILDISGKNVDNSIMDILSMGMSSDYVYAAKNKATAIRLGRAIFGERNTK